MDLSPARKTLHTPHLLLQAGHDGLAGALLDFQQRNQAHFARWDPPTPPGFYTEAVQTERLRTALKAFGEGQGFRWWISPVDAPDQIIGTVNFSQVSRGAFHSAVLGYAIDREWQGRGLMHEALVAALAEAFSPRINLHRVQAAFRPENTRSGALLQRLGFRPIGLSPDYLFIDGAWRDHQLCALLNPAFHTPSGW
ncbi:MAG: alanine acetyltransferase [Burkholderiales bacterium PBB6]|nr:MAG: alanine acetyltransferase [Burkholderiales bacterium PBB6]